MAERITWRRTTLLFTSLLFLFTFIPARFAARISAAIALFIATSCGKQNGVGTKFCSDCGTKLPADIQLLEAISYLFIVDFKGNSATAL